MSGIDGQRPVAEAEGMTREELAGCSANELIDLILQQQTLIEQLQTQVAGLEAKLQARVCSRCENRPRHCRGKRLG